jgi:hypothetical protein
MASYVPISVLCDMLFCGMISLIFEPLFACVVFTFSAFAGDITTVKMAAPGDKGKFAWPVLASYATPDILGC